MKKALTLVLALTLCLSVLSVAAFAAEYDYVSVTGTMNDWNASHEDYKMTKTAENVYTFTKRMEAGSYEFKFTANGNWDDLNLGGAFMGSGIEADLYWSGSNIAFTVEEACNVTIVLDLTNFDGTNGAQFTITIGDQVDAPVGNIKVHVSVPEDWGDVYVYVWNPEHLGSWSGTKVENGVVEIPAKFEGLIVNNGADRQTADIKDIDLTKEEVWIVVDSYNGYTLHYSNPGKVEEEEVHDLKVHVIVPEGWGDVYAYVWNPEHLGTWAGTKVENGVFTVPAKFDGMIISNGNGVQTGDITDIDLTKEEVWIVVDEFNGYKLYYSEPDLNEEPDARPIKIHVIAKNWNAVYAYTYNPELDGTWPGTLVENGVFETLNVFGGLVLSNGEGQQTWDITDIDLTKEEVWVVVGQVDDYGKCAYTLYYSEPTVDEEPNEGDLPQTGDPVAVFAAAMVLSAVCGAYLLNKKES